MESKINIINNYIEQETLKGNYSGVIFIAKAGNVLLNKGYGYAHYEKSILNNANTQYRIASITKSFTATMILQLFERGLLKLTDTINKYIPSLFRGDEITVHHLLSHTSGIYNFGLLPDIAERLTKPTTIESIIELFKNKPLDFKPGTQCAYSNSNYVLLTYIIECITRASYEAALKELICEPCGLKDSGYYHHNIEYPRLAQGYIKTEHGLRESDFYDSSWALGSGGMYSTAHDIYLFDQALHNKKIINSDSLRTMLTKHGDMSDSGLSKFYGFDYGYGWELSVINGKKINAVPGLWRGMRTALLRFYEDDITIISLCNIEQGNVEQIVQFIAENMANLAT